MKTTLNSTSRTALGAVLLAAVAAVCAVFAVPSARAQVLVGVQFSATDVAISASNRGVALASSDSTGVIAQSNWNVQTGGTALGSLVDSTGASTGITYSLAGFDGAYKAFGNTATTPIQKLFSGDLYKNGVTVPSTITLSGLNNSLQYNLVVYAGVQDRTDTYKRAEITAGGTTYYITQQKPAELGSSFVQSTSTSNSTYTIANYVQFNNLAPTSGSLTFSLFSPSAAVPGVTQSQFRINGFQLQAIPEPTTWALLAASLTTVMVLRRRRATH